MMTSSISGIGGGFSAAALKQMQEDMFRTADKNGDGSITKDELSQMQSSKDSQNGPSVDEIFTQMDSDNDGAISRLESDAGIAKLAQQMQSRKADDNSSSDLKEKVFKSADQNGDGGISKDELSQLLEDSQSSTDVTEIYDALDTNKDGSISKSESDAAVDKAGQQMQAQGPPPPPPPAESSSSSSESTSATQIFDALDTNEDGTVSASELLAAFTNEDDSSSDDSSSSSSSADNSTIQKIFDALDTNQDGSVSKTEMEEALAKVGQQMQSQGPPPPMAQGAADSSYSVSATDSTSSKDSATFAAAIKSYMEASISSFSQSSNNASFSSLALYG